MYDCSTDTYEENVRKVKEMADLAHSFGAIIEGELGHVGDNEGSAEGSFVMNDPSKAKDFVDRTGVDALAIAVGNAHCPTSSPLSSILKEFVQLPTLSMFLLFFTAAQASPTMTSVRQFRRVSAKSTSSPTLTLQQLKPNSKSSQAWKRAS